MRAHGLLVPYVLHLPTVPCKAGLSGSNACGVCLVVPQLIVRAHV